MHPYLRALMVSSLFIVTPLHAVEPQTATFAGGCFWCVEEAYDQVEGVISTTSGYANGNTKNPSYAEVSKGNTGYVESLQVVYDPDKVNYGKLLEVFWHNHDPTDGGGQFCDRGNQYRPAIFYANENQRQLAEESRKQVREDKPFERPIITSIEPLLVFYPAEEKHQGYYRKNPVRYNFYKYSCGRAARLEELWGKK